MRRFLKHQNGATAIEYAFIVAVVVLVFLIGLYLLSSSNTKNFNDVSQKVQENM